MYCGQCGAVMGEGARYCQKCGTGPDRQPGGSDPSMISVMPKPLWRRLGTGGGILIVLGFFLPWISASCDVGGRTSQIATFSGFDLATGPKLQTIFGVQQLASSPMLWLVPIAGIVIVAAAIRFVRERQAAWAVLAGSAGAILTLILIWKDYSSQQTSLVRVSVEFGLWACLAGLVTAAFAGVYGIRVANQMEESEWRRANGVRSHATQEPTLQDAMTQAVRRQATTAGGAVLTADQDMGTGAAAASEANSRLRD
jgi:hypothetical protein